MIVIYVLGVAVTMWQLWPHISEMASDTHSEAVMGLLAFVIAVVLWPVFWVAAVIVLGWRAMQ